MMKITHIRGQEVPKAPSAPKQKKPTAKQLGDERVRRWILKQNQRDYDAFCKENADRIAEIRKHDPDWELPRPF